MKWNSLALAHFDDLTVRCPVWKDARAQVERAAGLLCQCHRNGGKILLCGNGGSAADCEHIVGELAKGFELPRALPAADRAKLRALGAEADAVGAQLQCGVAAIALTGHAPLATATQNDSNDATLTFAQQVYVYGRPGDVLIAISTSGNSRNVLRALQTARAFGLSTLGLSGQNGGAMAPWCDLLLCAPAKSAFRVQELHLPLYHTLCLAVEAQLFGV